MGNGADIFQILFILLMAKVQVVQASGKMTILLVNYKNPKHQVFNGDCCDNLNFCSWNDCDNLFKFCAASLGSTEPCSLSGQLTTGIQSGGDDFWFPGQGGNLGGGVTNPITFSFQKWKGVSVVVEVWDDDGGFIVGKLADFVDKYTLVESNAPESNRSSSKPRDKKLCGKRSCTNVKIRVYCDDHYLIPECTEYCVAHDSDEEGHYWCDYERGRKVCREGWYDLFHNCTKKKKECVPRNDTIRGYYSCDPESGAKVCLKGWMGSNCTEVYVPYSALPHSATRCVIQPTSLDSSMPWQNSATNTLETAQLTTVSTICPAFSVENFRLTNSDLSNGYSRSTARQAPTQSIGIIRSSATTLWPSAVHHSISKAHLHTSVAVTKETNKETSYGIVGATSLFFVKESVSLNQKRTSSLSSTFPEITAIPEVVSTSMSSPPTYQKYTSTRQIRIEISATEVQSTVIVSPLMGSTQRTSPTTEPRIDMLVLNISPVKNWTKNTRDQLESVIKDQVLKYCKLHPVSCNVDSDVAVNRTEFFNTSEVIIVAKNRSRDVVSVFVRVKLPRKISDLSGIGLFRMVSMTTLIRQVTMNDCCWDPLAFKSTLPSIVLRKVMKAYKSVIEKQTGLEVSLVPSASETTASSELRVPTTADTEDFNISTPTASFTPRNLWIYIVGACAVCLVLVATTLCVRRLKTKRQNKIHPLDGATGRNGTMTRNEEEEMVSLSKTQPLTCKTNTLKVKFQESVLRARTSSINSDKNVLYDPFIPDYNRRFGTN